MSDIRRHQMGIGELARFDRSNCIYFLFDSANNVGMVTDGDEVLVPLNHLVGNFDHFVTADEADNYFRAREDQMVERLVQEVKLLYPKLKDKDIHKWVAYKDQNIQANFAWKDVAPFVMVDEKKARMAMRVPYCPDHAVVSATFKELSTDVYVQFSKALKKFGLSVVNASDDTTHRYILISKEKISKRDARKIVWGE